jgi:hypothetical protein
LCFNDWPLSPSDRTSSFETATAAAEFKRVYIIITGLGKS